MSIESLCRLCVSMCVECKSLYDSDGRSNEVYDTTVKYFDPMILNLEPGKELTVICDRCWFHIKDFHDFQASVLLAQTKLSEDVKHESIVKTEDLFSFDPTSDAELNVCDTDAAASLDEDNKWLDEESDKVTLGLTDMAELDIINDDPFSSDDEKPLIECLPKNKPKRRSRIKSTDQIMRKNDTTTKRRGRKRKSVDDDSKSYGNEKLTADYEITKLINDKLENASSGCNDRSNISSNDDTDCQLSKESSKSKKSIKEIDEFIAQWKQHLDCVVCSQTYSNLTLLRKHFRDEHPKDRCYISCCQRKLRHRFHIEEHIRFHIDPNSFKCDVCGKCCTNSRSLNNHKIEKHTEGGQQRPFECPECLKCFAKKTVLKCHMDTHKTGTDFICRECGKGFATEQRRKVHERMVHNVDRVCDQCGKTIHGIYALKQHLLEHAGIQKPKWPCDLCNAQLYSHSSLKRHRQVAHHDGSTVYVCGDCGKIAATATALRSHKKYVHEAERKHKCTICDKAFKVAVVLREHMATHTGEDLYTCPHCPRTFKVSSNMHHHRKKAHPKEWAEGRLNRPQVPKVDVNQVAHEVIM